MNIPIISVINNKSGIKKLVEMNDFTCLRITADEKIEYFDLMENEGIGNYSFDYKETALGKEVPGMDIIDVIEKYYKPHVATTLDSDMKEELEQAITLLKKVNSHHQQTINKTEDVCEEKESDEISNSQATTQEESSQKSDDKDISENSQSIVPQKQLDEHSKELNECANENLVLDTNIDFQDYGESTTYCFTIAKKAQEMAYTKSIMNSVFSSISDHVNYKALKMIANAYYDYFNKEITKDETVGILHTIGEKDFISKK